jgi:hypothetical protein
MALCHLQRKLQRIRGCNPNSSGSETMTSTFEVEADLWTLVVQLLQSVCAPRSKEAQWAHKIVRKQWAHKL